MGDGRLPGVAIIEPVGGHGGMNFYDFALAEGLARAGVATVVYTCDETERPTGAPFDTELSFRGIYGDAPLWRRGLRFAAGLVRTLRSARRRRLKLAHFHFFHPGPLEMLSVAGARLAGMKVIITAHDVTSFVGEGSHAMGRRIYGWADGIIAHNPASAAELVSGLGLSGDDIDIISSGHYRAAAATAPSREEARRRLGLAAGETVVLFFGQIKEVKGLDLLLQAFPEVCRDQQGLRLVIAGKVWKDDFSKYQDLIDRGGVADRIRLDIRFIPDEDIGDYYAAADVVALPYRKIYQSAVLLMALSHGRAVLVSDLPGMTDIVTHGVDGCVFSSGDAGDLAVRLKEMVADAELRARLETAAVELMDREYSWERVAADTMRVYRKALER